MKASNVLLDLKEKAQSSKVKILSSFFKTAKGQYGEGDVFLGVTVPDQRKIAEKYSSLFYSGCFSFGEISKLLKNKIHECRLTALLILVYMVNDKNSDKTISKKVYTFYFEHVKYINNWDLVDVSARDIVGKYLFETSPEKSFKILSPYARSKHLWTRRISIIATLYFIKQNSLFLTYSISDLLLKDHHDLIHKAVGWMLREVGKKDELLLKQYLKKQIRVLPRTTLRYAIERFSEAERKEFLS